MDVANLVDYAAGLRHGSFPMKIHPSPYRPTAVTLPMKSNRDSYGPWSVIGVPGKVNFQRDESLVPWNYGDFDTMNQAAIAKLANSATNMQEAETAYCSGWTEHHRHIVVSWNIGSDNVL